MDPEYIASKLSLLPQFEVVSIDHRTEKQGRVALLRGYFSSTVYDGELGAHLFLSDMRFLDGLLLAAEAGESLRTIEAGGYSWSDIYESEVVGKSLAFFGNYDRRRLNLVINPEILWRHVDFQPRTAVESHFIGTDGKFYRSLTEYKEGKPLTKGETLVSAGWDHEHCLFCMDTIDAEHPGYISQHEEWGGEWVCVSHYQDAIEPHDPSNLIG